MKDEPDWMVEQMLRRKREDLLQRWQEREELLAKIRAKERELEARGKKRRRIEDPTSGRGGKDVDEDAEFLLDDWDDDEAGDDPMSIYSKETRALMESMGLGAPKTQEKEAEEEEEIKVCSMLLAMDPSLSDLDLLHIKDTFPAVTVYLRASPALLPFLCTSNRDRSETHSWSHGGCQACSPIISTEAVHQPLSFSPWLAVRHQRPVHGTPTVEIEGQVSVRAKCREPVQHS